MQSIRFELERIEESEAQATLTPGEMPNDTLMVMTLKGQRQRLLEELDRCREIVSQDKAAEAVFEAVC